MTARCSPPDRLPLGEVVDRDGFVRGCCGPIADSFRHCRNGSRRNGHDAEGVTPYADTNPRCGLQPRCVLTEETTETLYLSGKAIAWSASPATPSGRRRRGRSRRSRRSCTRATRRSRRSSRISILAFSDLQAEITNDLVKRGYPVFTFNQRSVAEILQMIRVLGGIVGVPEQGRRARRRTGARTRRHSRARAARFRGGRACISRSGTIR